MASSPPILLFGAGPYARLLRRLVEDAGRAVAGFVVDEAYRDNEAFDGLPVGVWDAPAEGAEYLVAMGYRSMSARAEAANRIMTAGGRLATIVSPGAQVAASATIGLGNIVFPGCIVEHFVTLGPNNVLWSGTIVAHDTIVGAHNFLAPGVILSGNCTIGDRCFFGTRATVINGIAVGSNCHVVSGTVLVESARSSGRYMGLPGQRNGEIDQALGVRISRRNEPRESNDL